MKTLAKPVEMISWTEENGKIHPIRFKLSMVDGERQICRVGRIYSNELDKVAGNKMYKITCEIIVNNGMRMCELRYELDSCRWVLFKM